MSLELCRHQEISPERLVQLEAAMTAFYRNPPPSYHQISGEATRHYNTSAMPFHCDLLERISPGDSVLELGCGTAHLCPHVEARGGTYTGVDYGGPLLEENQRRYPRARFRPMGMALEETYDIVASLYTIEHIVNPPAYLELMWGYCRSGGLMAIICPEFVEGPDLPPSCFYGRTPKRLREKLQALNLVDVGQHLMDLHVRGPRWKKQARATPPGAFWINLLPRVLHGAEYSIDADAAHLVQRRDLVWFFRQKGGTMVRTSADMNGVSADILRYNCYVLARKIPGKTAAAISSG